MESNPTVSIIVNCFMQCGYAQDVYWSCLGQKFKHPHEVIYIHDGCRTGEGTGETAAGARNQGVAKAKGEWVLCNDGDNYLPSNYLQALWNARVKAKIQGYPADKLIVGCPVQFISGRTLDRIMNQRPGIYRLDDFKTLGSVDISVSSMVSRSAWNEAGGMEDVFLEDFDFWLKLLTRGFYYVHTWETTLLKTNDSHCQSLRAPFSRRKEAFQRMNEKYGLNLQPQEIVG